MADQALHIGFIVHGHPSRRKRFERALEKNSDVLSRLSYRVMYTKPGMAATDARNLADEKCTHIIGVGGDGTISEVIQGILSSDNPSVIAGLLPQGTANDWSKTWPSAPGMKELIQVIESKEWQAPDVGQIEFTGFGRRYFINIADIGIGAEVVKRVNNGSKWLGANLTFFMGIVRTFIAYRNVEVTCISDDWEWQGNVKSVIAANGKFFGSGLGIAPNVSPGDGLLDVVIIGDVSMADYLKYLPSLRRAQLINDPRVIYKQARSLRIEAPATAGVEADGELFGQGSVTISIKPGGIRMLPPFKKEYGH